MTRNDQGDATRRRIRRNAILLGLVAIAIYAAFIASSVMGGKP